MRSEAVNCAMANAPDSWEDDLSEDTRNMNIQGGGRGGGRGGYGGGRGGQNFNYNPGAQSFTPSAQAAPFVPGGYGTIGLELVMRGTGYSSDMPNAIFV